MRLDSAHVRDYRLVQDSGEFQVEPNKTILVGVNEAGKTALLKALQTVNGPEGIEPLEALRDFPRSRYDEIQTGRKDPSDVWVAKAAWRLAVGASFGQGGVVPGRSGGCGDVG